MNTVGERIKKIRMSMNLTQEQLSQQASLSKSFLSDIENNKTRVSGDNLLKIAEVLGASLDYLMKGDAGKKREEPQTIEFPVELSKAAEELEISYRETLMLLDVQKSIVARRSSKQNRKMQKDDWKQLFQKVRIYME